MDPADRRFTDMSDDQFCHLQQKIERESDINLLSSVSYSRQRDSLYKSHLVSAKQDVEDECMYDHLLTDDVVVDDGQELLTDFVDDDLL